MYNGFVVEDSMRNRKAYDGVTPKFGITVAGVDYLVKRKPLYSEYVASRFISNLCVPCQEVWLGFYAGEVVNVIKDFTTPAMRLHPFSDVRQSSEDTLVEGKEYTYEDVLHLLESNSKLSSQTKQQMLDLFWKMYVCDAILANRDRHHGNWGFLTDGDAYVPAPLYDNGGCLFPDVHRRIDEFLQDPYSFLAERSERFPASLFRVRQPDGRLRRTNYYEVCGQIELPRFVHSLSLAYVWGAICNATTGVPEPFCSFYQQVTCMRYLHIIERLSLEDAYAELQHYAGHAH